MLIPKSVLAAAVTVAIAGCAQMPVGPTIAVMPAPGMPFEVFQRDNYVCQQYAQQSLGVNPSKVAGDQVAGGALAGAAIGATAGALMGGNSSAAGAGAATGLLFGTAAGAGAASDTSYGLQRRYNIVYAQCMYAKGNQVPGYAAPPYVPPPPPPGSPPPPPTQPPSATTH
ncbi:MAG TPA: hypothetical protein VJS89_03635 [Gammaproteobacteria bacterium]|nr:hypothetical protein [Gammaproteobacteria bacterium]